MTAAERRALSRQRAKAGQVVLTIVTDRADLIALLEDSECIDGMREESKTTLAHGLEELLRLLHAACDAMDFKNMP